MRCATAARPSPRWSDATAMTTEASEMGTTPVRCSMAIRRRLGHRARAPTQSLRSSRSAIGSYASYSRRKTARPSKLSRVTPENVDTAPAAGTSTRATSASKDSGDAQRATWSHSALKSSARHRWRARRSRSRASASAASASSAFVAASMFAEHRLAA
eukprot:Amastigsp_a340386_71.p3 type:complete len:158 gc:universal Amastigsp_a340386_71:829-356(-)